MWGVPQRGCLPERPGRNGAYTTHPVQKSPRPQCRPCVLAYYKLFAHLCFRELFVPSWPALRTRRSYISDKLTNRFAEQTKHAVSRRPSAKRGKCWTRRSLVRPVVLVHQRMNGQPCFRRSCFRTQGGGLSAKPRLQARRARLSAQNVQSVRAEGKVRLVSLYQCQRLHLAVFSTINRLGKGHCIAQLLVFHSSLPSLSQALLRFTWDTETNLAPVSTGERKQAVAVLLL